MCKVMAVILGACATGKSTLSRVLAGQDATEYRIDLNVMEKGVRKTVKAPYVLGRDIAIAGNLKNTSDAIGAVDGLYQAIDHCLTQRDIVVVDGFRSSNKLVRWVEEHPLRPAALFVYINLPLNENLDRLRKRRATNGKVEERLPNKTFRNLLRFRDRASGVWQYAREHYGRQPVRFLEIPASGSPEESARLVEGVLAELLNQPVLEPTSRNYFSPIPNHSGFVPVEQKCQHLLESVMETLSGPAVGQPIEQLVDDDVGELALFRVFTFFL